MVRVFKKWKSSPRAFPGFCYLSRELNCGGSAPNGMAVWGASFSFPGLVALLCHALSISWRRSLLQENVILFLFPACLHPPLPPLFLFFFFFFCFCLFLHRKKKFLDTDQDDIYKFGVNLAPGSAQSWREGLLQRSELPRYLSSTVKK